MKPKKSGLIISDEAALGNFEQMMDQVLQLATVPPPVKSIETNSPVPAPSKREKSKKTIDFDDQLDLHGRTTEEAIRMVQNFVLNSFNKRYSHILIITGQGHHSGGRGPKLKMAVQNWLNKNGMRWVKEVMVPPPQHGGQGAIWLVLR